MTRYSSFFKVVIFIVVALFCNTANADDIAEVVVLDEISHPVRENFGTSIANLGDIDGDNVEDFAVGASFYGGGQGAVYVLKMNTDGTVKDEFLILPTPLNAGSFGISVEAIGDIDGNGVKDIAVGAIDADGVRGVITIVTLDGDSILTNVIINNPEGEIINGIPINARFGRTIGNLGDLDGDGDVEIAVAATEHVYANGNYYEGMLYILDLDSQGIISGYTKIDTSSFNDNDGQKTHSTAFGTDVKNIGDFDGDGVNDVLIGARVADVVYLTFLNSNGTVREFKKIEYTQDLLEVEDGSFFGVSLGVIGDVDRNGIPEIAVGATLGNGREGSVWLIELEADGSVSNSQEIDGSNFGVLGEFDSFGESVEVSGSRLLIGAPGADRAVDGSGVIYSIELSYLTTNLPPVLHEIGNKVVQEGQTLTFQVTATDPDGDNLTYVASNIPSGSSFDESTGVFTWTPGFNDAGNYPGIEFIVMDDGTPMELDFELITITVGDVNRAPVIQNPGPQEVLEGESLSFVTSATDPDGDAVFITASGTPSGAVFSTTTGEFNWTPNLLQEGVYVVTFIAEDNAFPSEQTTLDVVITVGDNPTPEEQAEDLVDDVVGVPDLPQNVENSYLANLQKVAQFIADGKVNAAVNQLQAFLNKLETDYSNGYIDGPEYSELAKAANSLISEIQN